MKNVLEFLLNAGKLKEIPRTGFVWLGIKNPETIAQHIFRVVFLNWVLGTRVTPKINLEHVIKISLVHDLCEVYAGDMTPYWGLLPKDEKKKIEMLKRWVRLPKEVKERRDKIKFKKEEKSLQRLIKDLPFKIRKEIESYWLEYERMISREGRFSKQGDKVETLLQALEYWGDTPDSPVIGWWEEVEDLVDQPVLREFLKKIEKRFYHKENVNGELDFFLELGKMKARPQKEWKDQKLRRYETVAERSFLTALLTWVLGEKAGLKMGSAIKMVFVYNVYEEIFSKKGNFDFVLDSNFKDETINLWDQVKKLSSFEGKFIKEAHWLIGYLQALQYFKENPNFPILDWFKEGKGIITILDLLELKNEMEEKFLPTKKRKILGIN